MGFALSKQAVPASRLLASRANPPASLPEEPWPTLQRPSCWTVEAPAGPPAGGGDVELLVSSHQALLGFNVRSGCFRRLSAGRGHYYGVVPAHALNGTSSAAPWLLVGSQSKLAEPARNASVSLPAARDVALLLDPSTRRTLGWFLLPTSYLHDMVFDDSTRDAYAIDSDTGLVSRLALEVSEPLAGRSHASEGPSDDTDSTLPLGSGAAASLWVRRTYRAVAHSSMSSAAHINNLVFGLGKMWVMHNNMHRRSKLQLVDLGSGELQASFPLGGRNCHNPCWHHGELLYLLSGVGGLGRLSPDGSSTTLWSAGSQWFSKGLAVVDDIAYFGVSPKSRWAAQRNWAECELAAFDLRAGALLWRTPLPFPGLINAISAPRVAPTCSWRACSSTSDGQQHGPRPGQWAGVDG